MEHLFQWIFVIIVLALTTYSAFVIKNEKTSAFENQITLLFGGLEFNIPKWWSATYKSDTKIIYERTDTHYDWRATFQELPKENLKLDLQNIFENYAIENKIIFDEENAIIKTPNEILGFKSIDVEALRVEGTATLDVEKRIYIDIVIFKNDNKVIALESKSSILNGLLEGPFFEEMISQIKKPK